MTKGIPIFLPSDNNYAPYLAVCITSICKNTKSYINIYILDGGISKENKAKIQSLNKKFKNFSIEFLSINTDEHFKNFSIPKNLTLSTYNRLLIPKLKPELKKVIYIDSDTIVLNDIYELYSENLENYALGAIWAKSRKSYNTDTKIPMELSDEFKYFNAGVLLIDIEKWNKNNITNSLFDIQNKYQNKILHADETLLNKYFDNNYKILDLKYNFLDWDFHRSEIPPKIYIRHFVEQDLKPWKISPQKNCTAYKHHKEFWQYAEESGFYEKIKKEVWPEKKQMETLRQLKIKELIVKSWKKMENRPKISVIVPVYNAQEYLKRCLNSICNQTLKDIEIICVNDCSTDNSINILNEYAKKYNNLQIIDCKINGGESRARNIGLNKVTGEYIAFVDNDDEIDLNFYEKLYKKAKKTNADITKAQHYQVEYDGRKGIPYIHNNQKLIEKNKLCFIGMWWTAIYRTELIKNNNIKLPENLLISGDRVFLQKALLKANYVSTIYDTFYYHYAREDSGAGKILSKEKIISAIKAIKIQTKELNDLNIYISNPIGYDCIFIEQFKILILLHNSCNKDENTNLYAKEMIQIYKTCQRKENLYNFINQEYLCLLDFITNDKLYELTNFLKKYNSTVKFLAANLRAKMKNKEIQLEKDINYR